MVLDARLEANLVSRTFALPNLELTLDVVGRVENFIGNPEDEYGVPCWAEVWPAAIALAGCLSAIELQGKRVLELGCGLGLPGLVAAVRGAQVTFSDYHPEALELVRHNAGRLGLANGQVAFHLGDWRQFSLPGQFDLLLASDIMYDPKLNPYLLDLFRRYLAHGSELLVSHPGRPDTLAALEEFCRRHMVTESRQEIPVTIEDPYFPHYQVLVHCFRRLGSQD